MKKFGIRLPVLCALILLASVTALATVVSNINGLTRTPEGEQNNVTIEKPNDPNAPAVFTVKQTNAVEGKQYLVVVRKGEADDPTADVASLFYMGMEKATNGEVSFSAYPKEMGNGSYCVYMSTYGPDKLQKVATFTVEGSGKVRYLGDVDESGDISLADVQMLLNMYIHNTPLTGDKLRVANVDEDENGEISIADVQMLLNIYIHNTPKRPIS